jgi:hypothetical protein
MMLKLKEPEVLKILVDVQRVSRKLSVSGASKVEAVRMVEGCPGASSCHRKRLV